MSDVFEITIQGEHVKLKPEILDKYNVHGPRYTSYPTAPEWSNEFGPGDLKKAFEQTEARPVKPTVSLYYHLPFCEHLCWFCGCNVIINRNKEAATPYVEPLKAEIARVAGFVARSRDAVQFHGGGGTPTYLTPEQMADIYRH